MSDDKVLVFAAICAVTFASDRRAVLYLQEVDLS